MQLLTRFTAMLAGLLLLSACSSGPTLDERQSSEFPGLNKVTGTGFKEVWSRPGADLPGYPTLDISPMQSANVKVIQPDSSSRIRHKEWQMTPERQQALAKAWDEAMHQAAERHGLTIGGTDRRVLRVDATLTEVAPAANFDDIQGSPGRTTVYTENSGRAAVEIRLHDEASGELLSVIRDRRDIGASMMWTRANSITASADARRLLDSWADTLTRRISGS
jgi:hypothetical protein